MPWAAAAAARVAASAPPSCSCRSVPASHSSPLLRFLVALTGNNKPAFALGSMSSSPGPLTVEELETGERERKV